MRKGSVILVAFLCSCFLFPVASYGSYDLGESLSMVEETLPPTVTAELSEMGIPSLGSLLTLSPEKLGNYLVTWGISYLRITAKAMIGVMGVLLLTAVFHQTIGSSASFGASEGVHFATVLWMVYTITLNLSPTILRTTTAITHWGQFMLSYIPIFSGVAVASGLPTSALLYHSALIWMGQGVLGLSTAVLTPLLGIYCSLSISGVIGGNKGVASLSRGIKKGVVWGLTLMMTAFVGVVTLQSFVRGVTDLSVNKATKFVVGSFIPVVGSVLAEAFSVAKNSIVVVKSTVGTLGILGGVVLFISPLLYLLAWQITLHLLSFMGEILDLPFPVSIIGVYTDLIEILLALVLSITLVFIVSTAVILSLT